MKKQTVIIIPAYNPDDKFITFLKQLENNGFDKIIVVNDGSKKECEHYFDDAKQIYGCDIVTHDINKGYGKALKSGSERFIELYENNPDVDGFIHCDCDGQHSVEDIIKFSKEIENNKDSIIVGIRNFDNQSVPFKNRFGNKLTSLIFRLFIGINIEDTQCGLRAFPKQYASFSANIQGDGFEYTTSLLLQAKKEKISIKQVPIETIYLNNNETTHFNPFKDSIRIYSMILRFLLSSLSSFIIDIFFFSVFLKATDNILISTYLARILSCTYTFFMNENLVFKKENSHSVVRFVLLCIIQGSLSGFITHSIDKYASMNAVIIKIMVDTCLFFIGYYIQKEFIFNEQI